MSRESRAAIDSIIANHYINCIDNYWKNAEMIDKTLSDDRKIKEQTGLFAALADPTRLKLLRVLCLQDPPGCRCVNNLSHLLGITQPAISQHLRVLKSVGLVVGERRGFRMHYKIDPEGLRRCQGILSSTFKFNENCAEDFYRQNSGSTKAAN
jgi:DNA-binding transcriptional ArsR family regulator